ncbi:MAG: IclR family transcriptional regulator [Firmicutes bacterium]|nr:IclR family transcriptional regulator [Bacillota bacterium]
MSAHRDVDLGANHVKSVSRAARLLIALADAGTEVSLTDLSQILDLPASTVHRLASTMIVYRLVEQNVMTGKYRLGLEALHMGNAVLQQLDFRQEAKPSMERLAELTGETVNLSVLNGDEVVYIEKAEGSAFLRMLSRIGHRAPVHCTGVGKVLLSEMALDEVRDILRRTGMPALTPSTIVTFDGFLRELEFVRVNGYALDREECEVGASCVAAPIRNHVGKIVAGVSMSGPSVRFEDERLPELIDLLLETAHGISVKLGFDRRQLAVGENL